MISNKKVVIAAFSLMLFTSLVLLIGPAAQSEGAEIDLDDYVDSGEIRKEGPGVYVADETIVLPALSGGETVIGGAENETPVTIKVPVFGQTYQYPLFHIENGNSGKYTFKNLILETYGGYTIIIGDPDANGNNGSVSVENVSLDGSIESRLCDLTITSSTFICEGGDYLTFIDTYGGELNVKDSFFYKSGSQGNCINAYSENVTIDNCYFQAAGGSGIISMVKKIGDIEINNIHLNITDSTFVGSMEYAVDVEIGYYLDEGNTVNIRGSLFKGNGSAIRVEVHAETEIAIDQCLFSGLGSYDGPIVDLGNYMDNPAPFSITRTTFMDNTVHLSSNTGRFPLIGLSGMDGRIVNSTFYRNTVINEIATDADVYEGCIQLSVSEVDLINNTFARNLYRSVSDVQVPAALKIGQGSNANSFNNIYYSDEDPAYAGDTNIFADAGGQFNTNADEDENGDPVGDLDTAGDIPFEDIFVMHAGTGLEAGCFHEPFEDLYLTYGGAVPQQEITTVPLLPFGKADGKGVNGTEFNTPAADQRDKVRNGKPDLGAYTVEAAMLDLNGGYWDIEANHQASYPFFFMKDDTGEFHDKLAIAADPDDGLIRSPSNAEALNESMLLLGWSTDRNAALPDPMYVVDSGGMTLGEFEGDMIYYAVWGTEYTVLFVPGNGLDEITKTVAPGETVEWPTYGILNGMKFVKWAYDEEGLESPTDPEDLTIWDNMTFFGIWEPVVSPKVTVEFRNGDRSSTVTIDKGDPVSKPADPEREGYDFKGWFTAATGGSLWNFSASVNTSTVLYAQWEEASPFSVTFDPSNGSNIFSIEVDGGRTVYVPETPTQQDMVFMGWFTAAVGGTKWDFNTTIAENITLYAQWRTAAGDVEEEIWTETTEGVVVIAVVFASILASLGVAGVAGAMGGAASGIAATAFTFNQGVGAEMFVDTSGEEKNRRAVIFEPENGKSSWTSFVFIGRQADRPGNPKAPGGMTFSHWSETPSGPPFSFLTPITDVVHLYAVYIPKD